jgi:hypothetical protein
VSSEKPAANRSGSRDHKCRNDHGRNYDQGQNRKKNLLDAPGALVGIKPGFLGSFWIGHMSLRISGCLLSPIIEVLSRYLQDKTSIIGR